MRTGVSTHIHVYSPLNRDLLYRIAEAGFESVELYCNDPHWKDYDIPARRKEMVSYCEDLGLMINSVHTPFFRNLGLARRGKWYSISDKNPDIRRESVERAIEAVAIAEFSHVKAAVVHTGGPGETFDSGTLDRMFYSLEELTALAAKFDVTIALENITNDFSRGHHIASFIEESGLKNLGACYDCGHANLYDRLVTEFEEMAPVLVTTHIHDNTNGKDNHLLPFEGEIEWEHLTKTIAESGYSGDLIIETKDVDSTEASLTSACEAVNKIRNMISAHKEAGNE